MLHLSAALDKFNWVRSLSEIPGADSCHGPIPDLPARDTRVLPPSGMPERPGFSTRAGQIRLLHDLGNIELQAMELCYRSLLEYPEAPEAFREELMALLQSEAGHFRLCLEAIDDLGGAWGDHPVNLGIWSAVRAEDSLLDRLLIVHRYLEGNGLDAGETLLRRLQAVPRSVTHQVVEQIAREEVDHVAFGSRWYQKLCREQNLDPSEDFKMRFERLLPQMPRRIEYIQRELRLKAGFTLTEIEYLESLREQWTRFKPKKDGAPKSP